MNKQNKAQLEIFGLVIIVIMVILVFLIYTVYRINIPSKDFRDNYMNKEIATNFLIAMSKTTIESCHDYTVAQVLIDCASEYPNLNCFYKTSCEVLDETIKQMLQNSLEDLGFNYNLEIEDLDLKYNSPGCGFRTPGKVQGFQSFSLYPGTIKMILDICP